MIETLQADNLKTLSGVRHGFFTRKGGVSEGIFSSLNCSLSSAHNPATAHENRRRVAAHLGVVPEHLLSCDQIHSPDVVTVTAPWNPEDRPRADALVTAERDLALGILTADCVPLLFVDAENGVIGAAHAGWRGAIGGVIENTLEAMENLGANRAKIHAALGPCIWQNSYEVGPEFPAPFLAESDDNKLFFRPAFRADHYRFDLPAYVTAKLKRLGVSSIAPSPADTFTDEERFFSYRRNCLAGEKGAGSLVSVVVRN